MMPERIKQYTYPELEESIDKWIVCIRHADRNRQILKLSMLDGVTYERIAEKYNLTPRQVANIIYRCRNMLFKHL